MKLNYLVFIILAVSNSAFSASFDCTKAASDTEKLICGDEAISKLDEQLATSYKTALDNAIDKNAFKKVQIEWLKQQRACKDVECLNATYQERIAGLNKRESAVNRSAVFSSSKPSDGFMLSDDKRIENQKLPLKFKLVLGDSYPICQPYVDMLNKTKYMEYPACERKILPEFKQFKSVEWIQITDKKEMIAVMEKNIAMEFSSNDALTPSQYTTTLNRVKSQINDGSMAVYKVDIDLRSDGDIETVYKSVGFRKDAKKYNACEQSSNFYVNDSDIKNGDDVHKKYREKGYDLIDETDTDFIFLNSKIYRTWWSGRNFKYDIMINGIDKVGTEVCGITIQ